MAREIQGVDPRAQSFPAPADFRRELPELVSSFPEEKREAAARVLTALHLFQTGQTLSAKCFYCDSLLHVEGEPVAAHPTIWQITCKCGESDATFKGI